MTHALMNNYAPLDKAFVRGEGVWLYDTEGQRYLDALGGIAVCVLGHSHPAVSAALADQSATLIHTSNLYRIPLQEQLAARLTALAGMDKVFFCNSGAEANEAAIKLARLHATKKNISSPQIMVMEGSFHGRTMATLTATGNSRVQQGFAPLMPGFTRVPYNDVVAIQHRLETDPDICAILVEPIQGEGGIVIPDSGYLAAIREMCDQHDCLMMLDEIQTGMCRTGKWFAFQHENIQPDVMTLAKALGNGVPIGACLARGQAADLMQPGSHGSTFGGNPLAARAALSVLDVLQEIHAEKRAGDSGRLLLQGLAEALSGNVEVRQIRGKGLMIGIELHRDCAELVQKALDKNVLINVTAGNVIRLLPPLIMEPEQLRQVITVVTAIIEEFSGGGKQ
jgi:acetylornithine aminotransferase